MIDRNREPSPRELRIFGLLFAAFFGGLGAIALLRWELVSFAYGLWALAVLVAVPYYAIPQIRRTIVRAWTTITFPIGWVVSTIALGLVYFGVFTSFGLLMRLLGRDPMTRTLDRGAESYWIRKRAVTGSARYFKQY